MPKSTIDTIVRDTILNMDVGYMIADLKKAFAEDEEAFEGLVEVLKESLGEFLMDTLDKNEEHVTVEDLFNRLKAIINRRIDEV